MLKGLVQSTAGSRRRGVVWAILAFNLALLDACAPAVSRYTQRSAAADSVVRLAISREREIQSQNLPSNTVGVLPLRVRSADTSYAALGYGVAALMASDLARSSRLVIVERLHLDAVMRELDLVRSGRVDSSSAPRVGRIVGARRVIVGDLDIRPTGALQLGSTVANAASGRVDASLNGNATLLRIFDAEKAMVFRLLEAMGVTLSPAERRAIEPHQTRNLAAFIAFSNGVRAELNRDNVGAAANYAAAARLDPTFVEAGARAAAIQGGDVSLMGTSPAVSRVSSLSHELVNRSTPVLFGSGVDTPLTRQQLITITISIRTP